MKLDVVLKNVGCTVTKMLDQNSNGQVHMICVWFVKKLLIAHGRILIPDSHIKFERNLFKFCFRSI